MATPSSPLRWLAMRILPKGGRIQHVARGQRLAPISSSAASTMILASLRLCSVASTTRSIRSYHPQRAHQFGRSALCLDGQTRYRLQLGDFSHGRLADRRPWRSGAFPAAGFVVAGLVAMNSRSSIGSHLEPTLCENLRMGSTERRNHISPPTFQDLIRKMKRGAVNLTTPRPILNLL